MGAGGAEEKKASEDWCGAGIAAARRTLTSSPCEKHAEQMGGVVSHICTVHDGYYVASRFTLYNICLRQFLCRVKTVHTSAAGWRAAAGPSVETFRKAGSR